MPGEQRVALEPAAPREAAASAGQTAGRTAGPVLIAALERAPVAKGLLEEPGQVSAAGQIVEELAAGQTVAEPVAERTVGAAEQTITRCIDALLLIM